MLAATIGRGIAVVTLTTLGSACASILGDFQTEPDGCSAGDIRSCDCSGGGTSQQRCNAQGVFEACMCSPTSCGDGNRSIAECLDASTYCAADCCGDGIVELDECSLGEHSCPKDCPNTTCDASLDCDVALLIIGAAKLCKGSAAASAWSDLQSCLCAGDCTAKCADTVCSGGPASSACLECAMNANSGCSLAYAHCRSS